MHDAVYSKELLVSNRANGYRDVIASIDLSTYRRIPWEDDIPFFLISFLDPDTKKPLVVDPRGILKLINERATSYGRTCFAGVEYEVSFLLLCYAISTNGHSSTSISTVRFGELNKPVLYILL